MPEVITLPGTTMERTVGKLDELPKGTGQSQSAVVPFELIKALLSDRPVRRPKRTRVRDEDE